MTRYLHLHFLLIASVLVGPFGLFADTIVLKDGQSFSGVIARVTGTIIMIRADNGTEQKIEKRKVKRIAYSESPEERKAREAREESIRREQEALIAQRQKIARYTQDRRTGDQEKARIAALAAEKQAEEERQKRLLALEAEKKRQEEEAAQRKNSVASLEGEIAKLTKEEEELQTQEDAIRKRKEEIQKKKGEISPAFDPLVRLRRSAFVPGWGQHMAQRDIAGGLYFGGLAFLAGKSYFLNKDFRTAGSSVRQVGSFVTTYGAITRNDALVFVGTNLKQTGSVRQRDSADELAITGSALAGLYLWNLLDAYMFGPSGHAGSARPEHHVSIMLGGLPSQPRAGNAPSIRVAFLFAF